MPFRQSRQGRNKVLLAGAKEEGEQRELYHQSHFHLKASLYECLIIIGIDLGYVHSVSSPLFSIGSSVSEGVRQFTETGECYTMVSHCHQYHCLRCHGQAGAGDGQQTIPGRCPGSSHCRRGRGDQHHHLCGLKPHQGKYSALTACTGQVNIHNDCGH